MQKKAKISKKEAAAAKEKVQTRKVLDIEVGRLERCPVEKREFTVKDRGTVASYEGQEYYLCCPSCVDLFKIDPDKYTK